MYRDVRSTPSSDLPTKYRKALDAYLTKSNETPLHEAYELGRQALNLDVGLLGLVNIHDAATRELLGEKLAKSLPELLAADRFLIDSLAPFEMMQSGHQDSNKALRRLNQLLEQEAKRIAHLLHDDAAQMLAAVYLELAEIERERPAAPVLQRVERIKSHLDHVRKQLRHISHELSPPLLDQLGLIPALDFLADGINKCNGITVKVQSANIAECNLPPQIETALYRAVQEAFSNIAKHAQAAHVTVSIWTEERSVFCTVEDDGVGFTPSALGSETMPSGLGLLGIRERVKAVYGTLHIDSAPGVGTTLRIIIPLEGNSS